MQRTARSEEFSKDLDLISKEIEEQLQLHCRKIDHVIQSLPGHVRAHTQMQSSSIDRVSNPSSPGTYNRRLLHEAQDNFAQN